MSNPSESEKACRPFPALAAVTAEVHEKHFAELPS
jgi:hypothetical protein